MVFLQGTSSSKDQNTESGIYNRCGLIFTSKKQNRNHAETMKECWDGENHINLPFLLPPHPHHIHHNHSILKMLSEIRQTYMDSKNW